MSGKREKESRSPGERPSVNSNKFPPIPLHSAQKSHIVVVAGDNRPYVEVKICENKLLGLLDSGAQSTVIGKDCHTLVDLSNIKKKSISAVVKTADSSTHVVDCVLALPITYNGETKILNVFFVPIITKTLILGIDFWNLFHIRPIICDAVELEKVIRVSGSHELEQNKAKILQNILKVMPFSKPGMLSKTHVITHCIDTGDAKPIKQRQYVISPYVQKEVHLEIDRLLEIGAIHRCEAGPWNNPMISVRKPNGKVRLCLDARKLNAVTTKDAYPQQQINRILAQLQGTKVLSAKDFSDAFLQVELDEESRPKTAFSISGKGYFAYSRMPFGLCNSGATLCRLVDKVLGCDLEPHVFVYLDDIIVATATFEQHFDILKTISERLTKANLTISIDKSRFCMRELNYLGYIIGSNGIRPNPDKTAAIHNYPQPKNVKDVRRLLV